MNTIAALPLQYLNGIYCSSNFGMLERILNTFEALQLQYPQRFQFDKLPLLAALPLFSFVD
jgi:hypothetical protein